jgi:DNA processing protein
MSTQAQWLWMQNTFGTGSRRAHEAYERFGAPDSLLALPAAQIEQDGFLTQQEKRAVLSPDLAAAGRAVEEAEYFGAQILTPDSAQYPEGLRNIHAMPLILYAVGDLSLLRDRYLISMVGTRLPDEYGLRAARKLSAEIAALGGVVVSGLAVGIDAACHRGALEAGGKTLAFLAAGLDVDYPSKNHALRALIEKNGLVLTE